MQAQNKAYWPFAILTATLAALVFSLPLGVKVWVAARIDYGLHIRLIRGIVQTGTLSPGGIEMADGTRVPHYFFHALVILVNRVTGLDYRASAYAVGLLSFVFLALVIYALVRAALPLSNFRLKALAPVLVTFGLMIAAPARPLAWGTDNLYFGYLVPNVYHNPTISLLKPLALLLFVMAVKGLVRGQERSSGPLLVATAVLTVLSTFTKPSYIICLLPALGAATGWQVLRRQAVDWRLLVLGIFVPAVIALGAQYSFTFDATNRVIFAPFAFFQIHAATDLLPKFVLSILFPLAVTLLYFQEARRDTGLMLAWLAFLVGAFYTYFLSESARMWDGNFTWSGQVTLFILFVAAAVFLVRQLTAPEPRQDEPKLSIRLIAVEAVFILHVIGGVVWYASESTAILRW